MKYTVACEGTVWDLERTVTRLIESGWTPLGGIIVTTKDPYPAGGATTLPGYSQVWVQAMIHNTPEKA